MKLENLETLKKYSQVARCPAAEAKQVEDDFLDAAMKDPILYRMIEAWEGLPLSAREEWPFDRCLKACILQLIDIKERQREEIGRLQAIAPRQIRREDGCIAIWRCPAEFIPIETNNAE